MKLSSLLIAAAICVAGTLSARADIVTTTVTDLGHPSSGTSGPYTGYEAYEVSLSTTAGTIGSVVMGGTSQDTTGGVFGPLVQVWQSSTDIFGNPSITKTPIMATLNNTNLLSLDSHWLIPTANQVTTIGPADEDNNQVTPANYYVPSNGIVDGTGSKMVLTTGIANPAASLDLFYVVVPVNAKWSFAGSVGILDSSGAQTVAISGGSAAPEPASLSALALGGIALVARRRRKQHAR